ncbi:HAD family hydrolase [Candidatus Parcubacteria bacterium]|jgi:phosphoglycolate phosphatase-like HAD superfamily hydrolase|nr:MAG: HAD family hydrolase [Candidatus Parcubacteria bacterium]
MKKIRALISDLDGTALNSGKKGFLRLGILAERNGIDFTEEVQMRLRENWGLSPVELIMIGFSVNREVAEDVYNQWVHLDKLDPIPLVEGVEEMLRQNVEKGIINFIFTSRHTKSACDVLKRFNIIHLFKDVVGVEGGLIVSASEFRKPDPRSLNNLLQFIHERHGISKDEIVYVGDEIFDIQCGMGAGLLTFGVTSGLKTKEELITAGAPEQNVFPTLAHIIF